MTIKRKHTPTPYKLESGRCIVTKSGSFSIHANDDWNKNWVELDQTVSFIIRACNAHDELVAACELVLANLTPLYPDAHLCIVKLKSALRLARGTKGGE